MGLPVARRRGDAVGDQRLIIGDRLAVLKRTARPAEPAEQRVDMRVAEGGQDQASAQIDEMAETIKERGQLQPITVAPRDAEGRYRIMFGDRKSTRLNSSH